MCACLQGVIIYSNRKRRYYLIKSPNSAPKPTSWKVDQNALKSMLGYDDFYSQPAKEKEGNMEEVAAASAPFVSTKKVAKTTDKDSSLASATRP